MKTTQLLAIRENCSSHVRRSRTSLSIKVAWNVYKNDDMFFRYNPNLPANNKSSSQKYIIPDL